MVSINVMKCLIYNNYANYYYQFQETNTGL